ncbi:hypothetical protein PHLH7_57130 [Pseudomonas sp. Ost2]|nr:hypothetical protein PHLH7_57130 [Pseudomonas sp. Ost2]
MMLDVHVSGKVVVKSYRKWGEYVLKSFPGTVSSAFSVL